MIQEVKYNGYTASPSDYESPDGQMAIALNLVPEDGALKPVLPPKVVMQLGQGRRVAFIHKTADFKNYIIHKDRGNVHFTNDDMIVQENTFARFKLVMQTDAEIYSFTAVGNTLVILASDGMHYFLWKADNETYLDLGTHIPECPISFGLQGEVNRSDIFMVYFDEIGEGDIYGEYTDNNKKRVTEQVLAKVNKFIAEKSTEKGRFIFPFLLRYAYRLYDGTLTMHSSPVLMVASAGITPAVYWNHISGKGAYTEAECFVVGVLHTIDYKVCDKTAYAKLKEWKDIVQSIDVFVSAPIYTYDQNGQCERFISSDDLTNFSVCKLTNQKIQDTTYPIRYQWQSFNTMIAKWQNVWEGGRPTYPISRIVLPSRSADAVKADIRSTAQFYFLKSIKLENLNAGLGRETIEVEEDYLKTLTTREVMTDDYDSHDTIIPRYAFAYNARLNVANLKKELYNAYNTGALFQYTDGYVDTSSMPTATDGTQPYTVYFYIKQDGRDIVVQGTSFSLSQHHPSLLFLYYPNVNAYKAVVMASTYQRYELKLEQHDFLNGAFYFGGWEEPPQTGETPLVSSEAQRTVSVPNKVYTSEVNNPFNFPVLGINTVGTGEILGISSAAKALSQGQFGQFPLYAFTTDGVWALEVSTTGTYSAKQPITRDVCINPESITQIDSAVLFATDRGIMLISGSETACLSDSIDSDSPFGLESLPKADKLIDIYNARAATGGQTALGNASIHPFRDFLAACRMVYDYTNQRIVVYNPYASYAYVYSLKSKAWGMMRSDIADNVNAYPDALATDSQDNLVNLSLSDAEAIAALAVTRPFKLGQPDVLKTIDTVIQRGRFRPGHVAQVLYGSRDLFNWHTVWSSADKYLRGFRGSPYKYFRLALVCRLAKDESLSGCTVQFTPRLINKPR